VIARSLVSRSACHATASRTDVHELVCKSSPRSSGDSNHTANGTFADSGDALFATPESGFVMPLDVAASSRKKAVTWTRYTIAPFSHGWLRRVHEQLRVLAGVRGAFTDDTSTLGNARCMAYDQR
jgi:hypothetical protein